MDNAELLLRIAETLKKDIGPAVDKDYPKTQAFMASVVLQKVAGQLASADPHSKADYTDRESLTENLNNLIAQHQPPGAIVDALQAFSADSNDQNLCRLIETLYANREALGDTAFGGMLTCIRKTMRGSIDRRMEYAR